MKKAAALIVISFILLGGISTFYMMDKTPSVKAIRANPALFKLEDYPDKIALHTRLSTLFPRGSTIEEVDQFLSTAGLSQTDTTYFECSQKNDYGQLSFIYQFPQKTLDRIQVDGWPAYNEYCKPELTPAPEDEKPIIVPLMPLPGDNN